MILHMNILQLFSQKPIIASLGGLVILFSLVFFGRAFFTSVEYKEIPVVRKNIQTSVFFSGSVVPSDRVALSFERSGRIASIPVSVGDQVEKGSVLIRLGTGTANALLEEARAQVAVEEAALETLLRGTRPEELLIAQRELEAQESAVLDAQEDLDRATKDAFSNIDTAIYTYTDVMFDNPQSGNPELAFTARDAARQSAVELLRKNLGTRIETVRVNLPGNSVTPEDIEILLTDTASYLGELSFLLSNRVTTAVPTQATVNSWQTSIATARGNIESAQTTLLGKEIALRGAQTKENVLEKELLLLEAGSTPESIQEQRARLAKSLAAVSRYEAELAEHVLISPIAGVVSNIELEVGEIAQVNTPVVEILSQGEFDIEADVSELDLPFIGVGDIAEVTFDAYRDDFALEAVIASIDPGERIVNGVPAYGVTLRIEEESPRIRSGLTANMIVESVERENVLTLPKEAFSYKNGVPHVLVFANGEEEEIEIETGLTGRDGTVEVIAPLEEGDVVLIRK